MPYIITKKNGKPYKWDRNRPLLSQSDVADFQRDGKAVGDCWTFKSPVTMRTVTVGACKRETPSDLWGSAPKKESYAAYKRRMKRIAERARRTPGFVPYRAAPYERD